MNRKYWQPIGAIIGLGLVWFVLKQTGFDRVWHALLSASAYFPLILLLELVYWFFGMLSQRALYGDDRHLIPWPVVIRAGCTAYAIMGLVPVGRVVAESARALIFSKYVGKEKATAVAVQMQIVALFVTGFLGLLAALILINNFGFLLLSWATLLNAFAALILGIVAFLAAKRFKIKYETWPKWSFIFEGLSRLFQVAQNGFLVLAVGGALGIVPAFCSEAMHLIGATLGDLVPGQLGVTELVYKEAGTVLGLKPEDALSIALLAHMAQLFWVIVALVIGALQSGQISCTPCHTPEKKASE